MEACADHDASHAHGGVARRDYLTQVSASSSQSKWRKALRWMLDERVILLDLQENDFGGAQDDSGRGVGAWPMPYRWALAAGGTR
jgi:hypothetical protein